MNTIIIPTDFSSTSDNAMHYGAQLAQYIGYELYLLHVYQIPVSISDIPVMTISGEELKKGADEGLERCKEELLKTYRNLTIKTESRLGEITGELKEVCKEIDPLAVIIGSHQESSFERLLFGSTTLSVIRHIACPVLVISSDARFAPMQTLVFATDFASITAAANEKITGFTQLLGAGLHIVHVNVNKETEDHSRQVEQLSQHFRQLQPVYHEINDEDVAHGIKTYVEQNKAGLIIVIPHKHNFWDRFFSRPSSESVLMNVTTPVLFLPE
jgi:nucleotide-binding universal stress UspA family protein